MIKRSDNVILNEGQQRAVEIVSQRYKEGQPYSVLTGPAGSGKTTSISSIIQNLSLNPNDVIYLAPTGKASQVLKRKGNPDAQTLHKFLYYAQQDKKGRWSFKPKEALEFYPKLIVVDEISMVDPVIWRQLLTHHVPILALGDDAQLSPVSSEGDNHLLDCPHARLTEIMRQAEGNEIIDLATHIRLGSPLFSYHCRNEQVQIISKKDLVTGHYTWADQIICATNKTRIEGNQLKRQILGYNPDRPEIGDSIISLHNHWDFLSDEGEPLLNGSIGRILDYDVQSIYLPRYIYQGKFQWMWADIETDYGDIFRRVPIDYKSLITGKKTLSDKQEMQLRKCKTWDLEVPFVFDYSYFCTCWKMQGDQADNVLLFEENFPFDSIEHGKYLYTGITRSVNRCVVVKK